MRSVKNGRITTSTAEGSPNVFDQYGEHLWHARVPLSSVERHGDSFLCELYWHFEGLAPEFEYQETIETVNVDEKEVQVHFKSIDDEEYHADIWVAEPVPSVLVGSPHSESVDIDTLARVLDEVYLDARTFHDTITGGDGDGDFEWRSMVTISAYSSTDSILASKLVDDLLGDNLTDEEPQPSGDAGESLEEETEDRIQLRVALNAAQYHEIKGIFGKWRWDHVTHLVVNGERYPVDITMGLFYEGEEVDHPGAIIHLNEEAAGYSDKAKPLDFLEEIRNIDLDELLHGNAPVPEHPLGNPF